MTTPTWWQAAEAEKRGVQAGWLSPCPHIGVMGTQCIRAAHHSLPHIVPPPADTPKTSQNPAGTPEYLRIPRQDG